MLVVQINMAAVLVEIVVVCDCKSNNADSSNSNLAFIVAYNFYQYTCKICTMQMSIGVSNVQTTNRYIYRIKNSSNVMSVIILMRFRMLQVKL